MADDVLIRVKAGVPVDADFQNIVTADGGFTRIYLVINSDTGRPYTRLADGTIQPVALGTGGSSGTNTGDVTLAGTYDYLTLTDQVITLTQVDAATDISGLAAVATSGAHGSLSSIGTNTHAQIDTHLANTSNPHSVTSTQVGLGSVTNDAQTKAAIVPNTAPAAGKILVGNAGGTAYAPVAASGDATLSSTGALTLATVNANTGAFGSATAAVTITLDAKGRATAASSSTITPAVGSITGLGTGVATALGVNVGSAGAFVTFNGALGTPSSGTLTSATGLPVSTGISGFGTGVATALAVNTGSAGAIVTFNGAGGTPSSITLTNATGTAASLTAGAATTATNVSGGAVTLGASNVLTFGTSSYVKAGSSFGVLINDSTDSFNRYKFDDAGAVRWYTYGVGTATFDASGNITSVSGEEYKIKDGAPNDPVSMLMGLAPGYYHWKDTERFNDQRQLGFYAQNVNQAIGEEAAPTPVERTYTNEKGEEVKTLPPWGYYDRSVLAVVVLALQEVIGDFNAYKKAHPAR